MQHSSSITVSEQSRQSQSANAILPREHRADFIHEKDIVAAAAEG